MTKITTSQKAIDTLAQKYCRLVLTEDSSDWHRLVERADGVLEYQIGAGKCTDLSPRGFRLLIRSIVQAAKSHQIESITLQLDWGSYTKLEALGEEWFFQTVGENLALASYEFTTYKTKSKKAKGVKDICVCNVSAKQAAAVKKGLTIAAGVNTTRDIANTAAEDMEPSDLAKATKAALKGTSATVKVLNHTEIKKLKMGILEAVGKGAKDLPKLIVIEYRGAPKQKKMGAIKDPVVLLGKGITYDTGGLNVKPTGAMHDMHMDMSGGAAVIGALKAVAELKLKKNVVGIIPAAENAVSDRSMRAGDIVTSMSGQTVEVLHTDAEGRMVLADGLTYIGKYYKPKAIIDIATLTGASLVALGQHTSAVLTKDEVLQNTLTKLGETSGDLVWPLPLWSEYESDLKSDRADYCNIAKNFSRYAGCIEGGTFLSFFAPKNIPWAHIDMAPRMTSVASDKLAKGATGEPVRLLVKYLEEA